MIAKPWSFQQHIWRYEAGTPKDRITTEVPYFEIAASDTRIRHINVTFCSQLLATSSDFNNEFNNVTEIAKTEGSLKKTFWQK